MTIYVIILLDLRLLIIKKLICEFDDVGLPCEVVYLQSKNEIEEFELKSKTEYVIDNPNLENYDKFKKDLCQYINNHISHKILTNFLIILRKRTGLPFAKDSRTLLNTLRNVECIPAEMQYYHFGFNRALKKMLREHIQQVGSVNILKVFINIDGLTNCKVW